MGTVDTASSSSSPDSHMTLGWDNPTADPTTTILLRHGDTRLSPEHRFSGLRDLPLSANGTRQAQAAARRLATGAPIDAVVSSPLQRALATAASADPAPGVTAVIDDDPAGPGSQRPAWPPLPAISRLRLY